MSIPMVNNAGNSLAALDRINTQLKEAAAARGATGNGLADRLSSRSASVEFSSAARERLAAFAKSQQQESVAATAAPQPESMTLSGVSSLDYIPSARTRMSDLDPRESLNPNSKQGLLRGGYEPSISLAKFGFNFITGQASQPAPTPAAPSQIDLSA